MFLSGQWLNLMVVLWIDQRLPGCIVLTLGSTFSRNLWRSALNSCVEHLILFLISLGRTAWTWKQVSLSVLIFSKSFPLIFGSWWILPSRSEYLKNATVGRLPLHKFPQIYDSISEEFSNAPNIQDAEMFEFHLYCSMEGLYYRKVWLHLLQ